MRYRLLNFWNNARESYWFLPSLMIFGAIMLAMITLQYDRAVEGAPANHIRFVWGGGPDGARGLLEVIAGSMMTVASLTFSLTIVAFSQASAQFGPRLLRNFIRDTGNQFVLGTFISTFVYCLLVLQTIRTGVEAKAGSPGIPEFVPYYSVSVGFLLGLTSLGVLIYFIHHVAQSIYAPNVIASVARDLMDAIERMFPKDEEDRSGAGPDLVDGLIPEDLERETARLEANTSGHLQGIDYDALAETAREHGLKLLVNHRPGHFIIRGDDMARVWPAERADEHVMDQLRSAFSTGTQRAPRQDVEFAMDQLVEVAVRALSAAINDPFTAINCIDWLGVALSRLAEKKLPPPYFRDLDGEIRILLKHPITFQGVTDAAFNQIRQQVGGHAAVAIRMLEVIAVIKEHTADPEEIAALDRQAKLIQRASRRHIREPEDLIDVDERLQENQPGPDPL